MVVERWCVIKICVKLLCVKDGVCKMVVDRWCLKLLCVKDGG